MTTQTWHDVRSSALGMATTLTVITPEAMEHPGLLILLHGLTGNHAVWPIRTDLQTLADRHQLVIALPDGQRSFWIDQARGLRWGLWVGSELPGLLRETLRISREREDTLIGGLSMGGYGAFRAALDYPQTFGGAFSLSGTLDVLEDAFRSRHPDLYELGFGDTIRPRPKDDLVGRLRAGEGTVLAQTPLFAVCGERDRLLSQNRRFAEEAAAVGVSLDYREGPGVHNFRFWNQWLPEALDSLRGRRETD